MKSTTLLRTTLLLFLFIFSLTFASNKAHAGPALILLQDYSQPTGEHFTATINGDEWKHWVSTDKDEVITQGSDQFWYYSKIVNGELVASIEKYAIDPPPVTIITSKDVVNDVNSHAPVKQFSLKGSSLKISQSPSSAPLITAHNLTKPHKLLVLLVSFTDKTISSANTEAIWNSEFFGTANSVNSYYKEVSNNKFYFEPAAETSGTADDGVMKVALNYAHPNTGQNTGGANQKIVIDALSAANAKINFAVFDTDSNGYISTDELHVVTIVAGLEASYGGMTTGVWGHHWSLFGANPPVTLDGEIIGDGNHLGGYVQVGEMHDTHIATIGIFCHELGHDLGLPDLYDTDNSSFGLGIHSIMASGSWGYKSGNYQGSSPTHFDAWSKMFLGFTSAPEATSNTLLDANAGDVYRVSTSNPKEYYLIENRQFSGYDAALAANLLHGGIAIYHIDEGVISSTLGSNTVNINELHKGIKIMEANQKTLAYSQLDRRLGGSYDHYFAGSALYTTFSELTIPSSNFYDGTPSGVTITATSPSSNAMNVQVQAIGTTPNASLSSIILSQGTVTPKFSGAITSYNATVTGATASITVTPTVAVNGSTITVNGTPVSSGAASGAISLNLGSSNKITIQVKSQDASVTKDYIVTVNRSQGVEAVFIALSKRELNLTPTSSKVTLTAILTPLTTTMKNITWSTNDTTVATVTNGVITAVGAGTTTIEARTDNGLSDVVVVNVTVPITKVELDQAKITLNVGDSDVTLHETVSPSGALNKKVSWTSSNTKSVTVDTYGSIHAVAPGTAIIIATSQVGAKSAKTTVTVPTKATAITITPSALTLKLGQTAVTLRGTLTPTTATYKTLSWSSEDTAIVTVDTVKGTVLPVSVGDTFVKVITTEGITNKIPVKVIIPVSKLILSPSETTITYQDALPMMPTFEPPNATNKDIVWTSSVPRVATVDSSGIAHAVNAGTTIITGKTIDGSKVASKTITVNGIALIADTSYLNINKPTTLRATFFNAGVNKTITWESSDPSIAEIGSTGLVTPKLAGQTTITASTYDKMYSDTMNVMVIQTSVTGISFNLKTATLKIGDADLTLIPTIQPSDASITKLIWASSNTAVATVDSGGILHAVAVGIATISATTDDGAKIARVTISVSYPVASIRIVNTVNTGPMTLKINATAPLKAAITPTTTKDLKVTWSSEDPAIASVSATGIVKGLAAGTTNIKVTTSDGSFTDTISVSVFNPISNITFTNAKETLKVGGSDLPLTPAILPDDATNKAVIWSSNNPVVATVDNTGAVHAVGAGNAIITATTVEGAKVAKVKVNVPNSVKSIKLLHADTISINLKSSVTLKASVLPLASTNLKVTWKSNNESVATVSATGVVVSKELGTTDITVTTVDGALTDTVTVNVIKTISSITLSKTSATLVVGGGDLALIAKILPADVVDRTLIWESSNLAAATVDSNGLVHPVSGGKATITATSKDGSKVAKSVITVK
jgi:M6 family metalloprotease-like protein